MKCRLANAPVSWGVDYADAPENPPWPVVLDEIAAAGYRWTELGPLGYLPTDPAALTTELRRRDLHLTGGFLFEHFHDPGQRDRLVALARRTARTVSGAGGRHLVLIDHPTSERAAVAGRPQLGRRLQQDERRQLVTTLEQVSTILTYDYGLRAVLHPHAATYVEHRDEIDRLLDAIDEAILGLCIDTGHCAYAGLDPVELYRETAKRTDYLHLKDVNLSVRDRAITAGLGFDEAVAAGIFCPLGTGVTNFAALHAALVEGNFDGTATVEQDVDPTAAAEALTDARHSLRFLQSTDFAEAPTS
jgi:inosose dehydratase